MKKTLSIITALVLALGGIGLQAQTNTFVIPLATNTVVVPAIPAITASSITVQSVSFNFAGKRADITVLVGTATKHYVVQGAAFTAMIANFKSQYGTAFETYLQAHPPTQ